MARLRKLGRCSGVHLGTKHVCLIAQRQKMPLLHKANTTKADYVNELVAFQERWKDVGGIGGWRVGGG